MGLTGKQECATRFDTIQRPTNAVPAPAPAPATLDQGEEAADPPSDHVEADDADTPGLVDALLEEAVSGDKPRSDAADKRLKAIGRKLAAAMQPPPSLPEQPSAGGSSLLGGPAAAATAAAPPEQRFYSGWKDDKALQADELIEYVMLQRVMGCDILTVFFLFFYFFFSGDVCLPAIRNDPALQASKVQRQNRLWPVLALVFNAMSTSGPCPHLVPRHLGSGRS